MIFQDKCSSGAGLLSCVCHTLRVWHGGMFFPSLSRRSPSMKQGVWESEVTDIMPWTGSGWESRCLGLLGKEAARMGRACVGWWERGTAASTWASPERKSKEVWSGGWRGQQEWQSGQVRFWADRLVSGMASMCGERLLRPDRCQGPSQVDWRSGQDISSKQGAWVHRRPGSKSTHPYMSGWLQADPLWV